MTDTVVQMTVEARPLWVRADGAEKFFGLCRASLNKMVGAGTVAAKRVGGCIVYRFDDVARAIEDCEDYR